MLQGWVSEFEIWFSVALMSISTGSNWSILSNCWVFCAINALAEWQITSHRILCGLRRKARRCAYTHFLQTSPWHRKSRQIPKQRLGASLIRPVPQLPTSPAPRLHPRKYQVPSALQFLRLQLTLKNRDFAENNLTGPPLKLANAFSRGGLCLVMNVQIRDVMAFLWSGHPGLEVERIPERYVMCLLPFFPPFIALRSVLSVERPILLK